MGIITEKDFIERIKNFDEYAFKAGERADKSVLDSHDFRYVKSGQFIDVKYSDQLSFKFNADTGEIVGMKNGQLNVVQNFTAANMGGVTIVKSPLLFIVSGVKNCCRSYKPPAGPSGP